MNYPPHPHGGTDIACQWCKQHWAGPNHNGYPNIVTHHQALFTTTYSAKEVTALITATPHPETVIRVDVEGTFDKHHITLTATAPFNPDLVLLSAFADTTLAALEQLPYNNTPYGEPTPRKVFNGQRPARTVTTRVRENQRNSRPATQAWPGPF